MNTPNHPPVIRGHRIRHTCEQAAAWRDLPPTPGCLACHIAADTTATRREDQ